MRDVLITNELLSQEAVKKGLDKSAEVTTQLDLQRQEMLANAYFQTTSRITPSAKMRSGRNMSGKRRKSATRNTKRATFWSKRKPRRSRSSRN